MKEIYSVCIRVTKNKYFQEYRMFLCVYGQHVLRTPDSNMIILYSWLEHWRSTREIFIERIEILYHLTRLDILYYPIWFI